MRKLFGTDGIRGRFGVDLTSDLARDVGRAVAVWSGKGSPGSLSAARSAPLVVGPRIVIGRDTRVSGPELEGAFIEGAVGAGAEVYSGGILPTAAVAYLMTLLDADAGIVISASHNPPEDNGIKFFGKGGWKLSEAEERTIEALIAGDENGSSIGVASELPEALDSYIAHLASIATHNARGLRVVTDCANGAASPVVPDLMQAVGIDAISTFASLDGALINDGCGALHPNVVAEASKREGAIGLTFDGDADRVLLADEHGRLVDGDQIIAVLAQELRAEGKLPGDAIVATVMANQALRRWCEEENIKLIETPVGDRHVLEAMRDRDLVVGGEQSGHIIRLDSATTGDGILAGLGVLDAVAASGKTLADLVPFQPFPQVMVNVRTTQRDAITTNDTVRNAIEHAEAQLGSDGRVLIRPSGTEPLIRVMVEAPEEAAAAEIADTLADIVCRELEGTR